MEDLELVDFWSGKGAISHVTLYGNAPLFQNPAQSYEWGWVL